MVSLSNHGGQAFLTILRRAQDDTLLTSFNLHNPGLSDFPTFGFY